MQTSIDNGHTGKRCPLRNIYKSLWRVQLTKNRLSCGVGLNCVAMYPVLDPGIVVSCVAAAALRGTDDTADNLTALRVSGSYENLEYSPLGIEHGRAPAPVAQLTKDMSIKVCPPFLHVTLTHVRGKIFQIGIPDGILDPT
eukprot:IDg11375t1